MYIAGRTGINFQIMTNRTYWNTRKTEYLVSLGTTVTFSSLVNLLISTASLVIDTSGRSVWDLQGEPL